MSQRKYTNNYNKGGYNKNYNRDKNGYYGKKDWNKNNKSSYQKDDKKESKDKDVYLTLTKDVKFRCPAGFNKNIFACSCRMIQEKVDSARQSGITDIKTVNVYDSAWAQATGEEDPASSGDLLD